ncbi:uncharacterized protein LOC110812865 [Carica papaya]|uniref:uncharacterized protein LOC110812865 n=1 Tax=Carica papaya TaxID=3649 RepID=UPI000B8C8A00|nr:uncharacterized protein LOC110812865 [Carica papaya]
MPQIPEIAKCPEHLLPLKEWEDEFLSDFSELRLSLSHLEGSSLEASGGIQPIVTANEENVFCQLMENIIVEKFINSTTQEIETSHISNDSSLESSADQPNSTAKENETSPCHKNPNPKASVGDRSGDYPTISAIHRMDSVTRVSTLRKRINSIEAMSSLSKKECAWLFALCAAVDTPLDADTSASIRGLLRKCASLRAGKSEADDEVIMLNILATISGRYFGQLDT